jgi:type III secretion system YscJ/HrcJ family lipoprotein
LKIPGAPAIMTPVKARRLILVLAAALAGGCADDPLVRAVPQRQALEIARRLDQAGIPCRVESEGRSGFAVRVSPSRAAAARQVLAAADLPREESPSAFAENELIPSETRQRARYQAELAAGVAETLRRHPDVLSADVGISLPEKAPLVDPARRPPGPGAKASVVIRYRGGAGAAAPWTEEQVRGLVAGRVAGLEPAAVFVVITPGAESAPSSAAGGDPGAEEQAWLVPGLSLLSLLQAGLLAAMVLRARRRKAVAS